MQNPIALMKAQPEMLWNKVHVHQQVMSELSCTQIFLILCNL